MRRLFLFSLLLPITLFAYASPGAPSGFVNDFAEMLRPETVDSLNQELTSYKNETGHEIAVVTVPNLGGDYIEHYAVQLFEEWGIGTKGVNNGLLLLIARDEREMRIEVGYGLEPIATDIASANIVRNTLTPAFKEGKFDEGVIDAVRQLESIAKGEVVATKTTNMSRISGQIVYLSAFALMFLGSILARSKSWWAGGVLGAVLGWIFFTGFPIIIILAIVGLIFDYIVSKTYREHAFRGIKPPWWIGGGGRGGGFGGGGFGGGMSGGGGASGKW